MSEKKIYVIRGYENFQKIKSEQDLCYWIQWTMKKWFWLEIFDLLATDILETKASLVIVSDKLETEEKITMVFCSMLGIPVMWDGPIAHLDRAEIETILQIDNRYASYTIPQFNETSAYVTFENDLYTSHFTLESPSNYVATMPQILVSPQYFKSHWFELSPFNGIPVQSLLVFPLSKKAADILNLEKIQLSLLIFLDIAGLISKRRLIDAVFFLLKGYGFDFSSIQLLLDGPRPNQISEYLSRIYRIETYQILSYTAHFPVSGKVLISFQNGEKTLHKLTISHSTFRCSCKSNFCPGVLIFLNEVDTHTYIDSSQWGILKSLIITSVVRSTRRKHNPRNFKETLFADESADYKYELTQLGKKILYLGMPPSKYFEILNGVQSSKLVDNGRFVMELILESLGLTERTMQFSNYPKERILELARDLSFKFGLSKALRDLNSNSSSSNLFSSL